MLISITRSHITINVLSASGLGLSLHPPGPHPHPHRPLIRTYPPSHHEPSQLSGFSPSAAPIHPIIHPTPFISIVLAQNKQIGIPSAPTHHPLVSTYPPVYTTAPSNFFSIKKEDKKGYATTRYKRATPTQKHTENTKPDSRRQESTKTNRK